MKLSLKLPLFGMNMEQGTIVKWSKQPGETFQKGESLYEVETEKVLSDVAAPCDGMLLEIVAAEGSVIEVGAVVCRIETGERDDDRTTSP